MSKRPIVYLRGIPDHPEFFVRTPSGETFEIPIGMQALAQLNVGSAECLQALVVQAMREVSKG